MSFDISGQMFSCKNKKAPTEREKQLRLKAD